MPYDDKLAEIYEVLRGLREAQRIATRVTGAFHCVCAGAGTCDPCQVKLRLGDLIAIVKELYERRENGDGGDGGAAA